MISRWWSDSPEEMENTWHQIETYLTRHHSQPSRTAPAENLIRPLCRFAWSRRYDCISIPRRFFSLSAETSMRSALKRRLLFSTANVADYEWMIFLNTLSVCAVKSDREDASARFFADGVERKVLSLANRYPELKRIWTLQVANWLAFFRRFAREAHRFARGARIVRLWPDLSDPHSGHLTVVRVRFDGGAEWYYKPRSTPQVSRWFKLLGRLNAKGFPLPFKILPVITRRGHHWIAAAQRRRCLNRAEERRFWFRAGALAYLVHRLRGVDFHLGNLVPDREDPIFVDCETLLHPETRLPPASARRERGLFRTGLFPIRSATDATSAAFDQATIRAVAPRHRQLPQAARAQALSDGFRIMHRLVSEKFRSGGLFRPRRCRVIYRPTAHYQTLLLRSLAPTLLTDAATRREFLRESLAAPHIPKRIVEAEAAALLNLDIPLFIGRTSGPELQLSEHDVTTAIETITMVLAERSEPLVNTASKCSDNNPRLRSMAVSASAP